MEVKKKNWIVIEREERKYRRMVNNVVVEFLLEKVVEFLLEKLGIFNNLFEDYFLDKLNVYVYM